MFFTKLGRGSKTSNHTTLLETQPHSRNKTHSKQAAVSAVFVSLVFLTSGCALDPQSVYGENGVEPLFSFPVTSNETPYSSCLKELRELNVGNHFPVFSIGEVADKTGAFEPDGLSREISQGASEMVISAFYKTGKIRLTERWDLRVPLAEMKLVDQKLIRSRKPEDYNIRPSNFVVVGAITELNFNISSGGFGAFVSGVSASQRTIVINVALDIRVINSQTFDIPFVVSLQKQIYGMEVDANIFRFFGTQLVGVDTGTIKNEPIQLGVRSVIEMAVYQIMTDFLGLPKAEKCRLVETNFNSNYLKEKELAE